MVLATLLSVSVDGRLESPVRKEEGGHQRKVRHWAGLPTFAEPLGDGTSLIAVAIWICQVYRVQVT